MNHSLISRFRRIFRPTTTLIGLDIGSHVVKMVQLRHSPQGWQLVDLRVEDIPNENDRTITRDGGARVKSVLEGLVEKTGIKGANVAVSISGPSVSVKPIDVPWMTEEELQGHLELEIEQYLPYERDDIYWDYYVPKGKSRKPRSSRTIYLVAAKREIVDQRVTLVTQVGLRPVVVDIDNFALANMYDLNYKDLEQGSTLLMNLGPSGFNMIALGMPEGFYMRDAAFGDECPQDLSQEEMSREIVDEIQRTMELCRSYETKRGIQRILLSGGYAPLIGLVDDLSAQLQIPVEIMNPFKRLTMSKAVLQTTVVEKVSALAGVAVGLALRCGRDQ